MEARRCQFCFYRFDAPAKRWPLATAVAVGALAVTGVVVLLASAGA